jgi:hypothetical protein
MRALLESTRSALGGLFGPKIPPSAEAPGQRGPGSLAYRKNKDAIQRGEIPEKYLRVLRLVPGDTVLELGAAEGVLSLLLAREKRRVIALEKNRDRHEEAKQLQTFWQSQGMDVSRCEMVLGSIQDNLALLRVVDTLLAVRSIYYLREDTDRVFDEVAAHVRHVVLCGNGNRGRRYFEENGNPSDKLGRYNYYSSLEGMRQVLADRGYTITHVVEEGDPIVVGVKEA